MEVKRYKPKFDKLYAWITVPTMILVLGALVLTSVTRAVGGIIVMLATVLFVSYFLISPCFGYVELRENTLFIKFGFFMKREIPYSCIRDLERKRTVIADSMLSLKNAMDHVNIKHNRFDLFSVSVQDEDLFIEDLKTRCSIH